MSSSSHPEHLVSGYLDHQLSPEERAEFEALLRENSDVRDLLSSLESQSQQLKALPSYHLRDDFSAQLLASPKIEQAFDELQNQQVASTAHVYRTSQSRFGAAATAIATLAAMVLVTLFLPRVADHADPNREVSRLDEDLRNEDLVDKDLSDKGLENEESLLVASEAVASEAVVEAVVEGVVEGVESRGRVTRSVPSDERDAIDNAFAVDGGQRIADDLMDRSKGSAPSILAAEGERKAGARKQSRSNFKIANEPKPLAGIAQIDRAPEVALGAAFDADSNAKQGIGQIELDQLGQQQMWLPEVPNQAGAPSKGSADFEVVPKIATVTAKESLGRATAGLKLAMTPTNDVEGLLDIRLPEGQNPIGFFNDVLHRNEIELGRSADTRSENEAKGQNADPSETMRAGTAGKLNVPVQQELSTTAFQSPQAFLVTATPKQMVGLMLDLKDNDAAVLGYRLTAAGEQIGELGFAALQESVEETGENLDRGAKSGALAVDDEMEHKVEGMEQEELKQLNKARAAANRSFQQSVIGMESNGDVQSSLGQTSKRGLALPLHNGIQWGRKAELQSANAVSGGRSAPTPSKAGGIGSDWQQVPASMRDAEILNTYFGATDQTKRRYLLFVRSGQPNVVPLAQPSVAAPQSADSLPAKK